jgi:hypothetical protein
MWVKAFLHRFLQNKIFGGTNVELFHILYQKSPKFYQKEATPEGVASALKFNVK